MPVTFGSVGDIIGVCLLVKDLVDALDKCRGSSAEYQAVKRELWVLERTLLEVERASRTFGNTPELNAICETARRAVEGCQASITAFSSKLRKYARTLGSGIPANPEELAKFRAEVAAHNSSINMLLVTAKMNLAQLNHDKMHARLSDAEQKTTSLLDEQSDRLIELDKKLTENNHLVSSTSTALTVKMTELLRLDWLRQIGTDLSSLVQKVFALNIATYKAVMEIQRGLPSHLERCLIQEPFILEDAIGRTAPVHLQFISSWEAFDGVLEARFRDVQGYEKVCNREYVLQEHSTRRDVSRSKCWEATFLPGQKVEMSMTFEETTNTHPSETTSCPRCHRVSGGSHDTDVRCEPCGIWFRRVTDVDTQPQGTAEEDQVPQPERRGESHIPGPAASPEFGPAQTKRRKLTNETEDSVLDFTRVRLIVKKPLEPQRQVSPTDFLTTYEGYTFRKVAVEELSPGEKLGWKYVQRTQMLVSSGELEKRVRDRRSKTKKSVSDEYNGLTSHNQRAQIDRLIAEKEVEERPYVEWTLASIESRTRQVSRREIETMTINVILKRHPKTGLDYQSGRASTFTSYTAPIRVNLDEPIPRRENEVF